MESKVKKNTEEFIFSTTDFQTAVVLRISKFDLLEIRLSKTRRKTVEFVFDGLHKEGITTKETLKYFWDYSLSVDARTMVEAQEELKTRMFGVLK